MTQEDSGTHASMLSIRPEEPARASDVRARLEIGEVIGRGGTSVVRRAVQTSLGREVAVKTLHAPFVGRLDHVMVREARVVAALQHPDVVPVFDLVPSDAGPKLVMARVEGTSWLAYLAWPDSIPQRDRLRFHLDALIRVTRVVEHAHARGLIHRDLKPENVMLGAHGQLYVVDWGLAMRLDPGGDPAIPLAVGARQLAGTPAYMAPEQLGTGELGRWTDIFNLGAVLFHALAGAAPYAELEPPASFEAIAACDPPFPASAHPELVAICRRAMAKAPQDRHPSAAAFREDLEGHLASRHATALASAASERLAALEALLDDPHAAPDAIHGLHGEVAFGFRQALREAAVPAAKQGLHRTATAMASWALGRGDPEAAGVYLTELPDPPVELVARRDALLAKRARDAADLTALKADGDMRIGQGVRAAILLACAVSWVGVPLALWAAVDVRDLGYAYNFASSTAFFAVSAAVGLLLHGPVRATSINRTVLGALVVVSSSQIAFDLGGYALGLDPALVHAFRLPLWAAVCAMVALTVRAWLYIPCAAYLVGFAAAVASIDALLPAVAWSNLVFAIVAVTLVLQTRR